MTSVESRNAKPVQAEAKKPIPLGEIDRVLKGSLIDLRDHREAQNDEVDALKFDMNRWEHSDLGPNFSPQMEVELNRASTLSEPDPTL